MKEPNSSKDCTENRKVPHSEGGIRNGANVKMLYKEIIAKNGGESNGKYDGNDRIRRI